MHLDETRIAIRERSFGEILGLALQVARSYAAPLVLAWIAGVLPFALFNAWLLYELLQDDLWYEFPNRYWAALLALVAIEMPIATAPIAVYLGRMTFSGDTSIRSLAVDLVRSIPQMFIIQVVLRVMLLPILLAPYWMWPYMNELILLERNAFFSRGSKSKNTRRLTTMRRSRNLHGNNGGELFGRWNLAVMAGGVLWMALCLGGETLIIQLSNWDITRTTRYLVLYPAALWMVVGWMAVVRFLCYLDLRIRREGWEVELRLRAEAGRLQRSLAVTGG